jgi:hypothetical protein
VITRVTLDVQPAYEVEQRVYERLSWDAVEQNFEAIASIANSMSFFTHWGEIVEQVWVKRRADEPDRVEGDLFGAVPATVEMHPTSVMDPTAAPRSWAGPVHGRTASHTFGWDSRRAAAKRSCRSTSFRAGTPLRPSQPCGGSRANAATIATLYERHGDFVRLVERLDPRGAFRNQWLQSHVLGNTLSCIAASSPA